ncbi:MAG: hypothetical protein LBG73_07555 [Spirochaetaceae bacterium]|jgi:hypothetical protein|nr:hypothetical protein [Spirochaetaceae bacterium]
MPEKKPKTERETAHIFDLTFKHILYEIGSAAVILFINGLFGRTHPLTAEVSFGKTETVKKRGKNLKNLRSDLILTVNIESDTTRFNYAVEVQIKEDKNIGLRIFEYAFEYARETKQISGGDLITLRLPAGCVIYWESAENTPDQMTLRLISEEEPDRYFDYKIRVFKMADQSLEELESKRLLVLLPFCLVKFRKELKRKNIAPERRRELVAEASELISEMETILHRSQSEGILTGEDAIILMEHSIRMHDELYGNYPEFKEEQMVLEERFQSQFKKERVTLEEQFKAREEAFKAREEQAVQAAFKRAESRIIELLEQGYSLERIKEELAREAPPA